MENKEMGITNGVLIQQKVWGFAQADRRRVVLLLARRQCQPPRRTYGLQAAQGARGKVAGRATGGGTAPSGDIVLTPPAGGPCAEPRAARFIYLTPATSIK